MKFYPHTEAHKQEVRSFFFLHARNHIIRDQKLCQKGDFNVTENLKGFPCFYESEGILSHFRRDFDDSSVFIIW